MRHSILPILSKIGLGAALFLFWNVDGSQKPGILAADKSLQSTVTGASLDSAIEPTGVHESIRAHVEESYGNLPLNFEANKGQVDSAVKFLARGNGHTLFLTSTEAVIGTRSSPKEARDHISGNNTQAGALTPAGTNIMRIKYIDANPNPKIRGHEELPGKSNYFIGNISLKAHTNISQFAKVEIEDVYPGIDLLYYGNQRQLEFDWIVTPGADPEAIRFEIEGKTDLRIDAQGNLILDDRGELRLRKPFIYQISEGARKEITGGYILLGEGSAGFQLDTYNRSLPLVIDPVLSYSFHLGGDGLSEYGYGIAVDALGNAYVTGFTDSLDFPTANAFQMENGGSHDVFVAKLNASGSGLIYSTYLGGSGDDRGYGIAVDASGNAYVTGPTHSNDFPTANALQASRGGGLRDVFVTKLDATGSALIYSTYLGGLGDDRGYGIAVDPLGNAYVTGSTDSTDFPTANAFQMENGGNDDAFIAKLNVSGSALIYSTYLGGGGTDQGRGIAADSSGSAYVTGLTGSTDFPTYYAYHQNYNGGAYDAFVTKLNGPGSMLIYSTYLGGGGTDQGQAIAVDSSGYAFLTGSTNSANFPTRNGFAYQMENAGNDDAFVTKLNISGTSLLYSGYLGGSGNDYGQGIAVNSSGNAYVTGYSSSVDFPAANPLQDSNGGNDDVFVTKFGVFGNELVYSTYIGSSELDVGFGIAVDYSDNAYVTGFTNSPDFPTGSSRENISNVFAIKIGASRDIFFPEIMVGGGWSTKFAILNNGATAANANLILRDQQGNPLTVSSPEFGAGSSFPISLSAGGSMFLTIDLLNPDAPSKNGWARIEILAGTVGGVATYQFQEGGNVTALAGVLPSLPMQFATIPIDDNVHQDRITAYAIANPTDESFEVRLCLVDTEGNVVDDSATIPLSPGEQLAQYLFQDLGFQEFEGSVVLRAQSGGTFVAVALIQNQTLFTVVPVEAGKAPHIPD